MSWSVEGRMWYRDGDGSLDEFLVATVTNYYKHSGLEQPKSIILVLEV
jgi:hypothetical protein